SLFIIGHMGLFFYNKIGSIISIGDLPTTNIIEPLFLSVCRNFLLESPIERPLGKSIRIEEPSFDKIVKI
ncbi:hypothetical protein, partial [Streptococcus pneumoniae]|uniref:hypothetical protein n=1 Tax=Streptococcus pneumoniae TaxID=1313 RepID=UPI000991144F